MSYFDGVRGSEISVARGGMFDNVFGVSEFGTMLRGGKIATDASA